MQVSLLIEHTRMANRITRMWGWQGPSTYQWWFLLNLWRSFVMLPESGQMDSTILNCFFLFFFSLIVKVPRANSLEKILMLGKIEGMGRTEGQTVRWLDGITEFSSGQLLSCVWPFAIPWTAARQASLSITNSQSPPKPMSNELVMPSNHLILCHPLLLPLSVFPSIRVFSNELALRIRGLKYWSFSFSVSPSHEYPGLMSFRMDWLDLLAAQGTLKSLLQHHSSKASIP